VRRKIAWVGGILALCALLFLGLILLLGGPSTPFEFLAGAKRLKDHSRDPSTYFVLKADYEDLRARAAAELEPLGFVDVFKVLGPMTPDMAVFLKEDASAIKAARASRGGSKTLLVAPRVSIDRDTRYHMDAAGKMQRTQEPGWVTVSVFGGKDESIFSRMRWWLGL
jgi:hypothetical protein